MANFIFCNIEAVRLNGRGMSLRSSHKGRAIYAAYGCTSSTRIDLETVFIQKLKKRVIYRAKVELFLLRGFVEEKERKRYCVIIFFKSIVLHVIKIVLLHYILILGNDNEQNES
jgi:hypothetical protein